MGHETWIEAIRPNWVPVWINPSLGFFFLVQSRNKAVSRELAL